MSDDPPEDRDRADEEPVPESGSSGSSTGAADDESTASGESGSTDADDVPEWARSDEERAADESREDAGDEDAVDRGDDSSDERADHGPGDGGDRDDTTDEGADGEQEVYRSLEGENEPDPPTYESPGTGAESGADATAAASERSPIERKAGPAYDQEQPLADHVEEMIRRLAIVALVVAGVTVLLFPFAEGVITFLWYSVLPEGVAQPHVYHPLELLFTQLKTASLAGLVLALPVLVYETYAFMRPGLYPHERRYYLAAVPTSLFLALLGLLFGYFLVLPAVMRYFLYYTQDVVDIAFALGRTFDLMLTLLGYLAIVFQIPLFVMLAITMGLTSRQWLEDRRLIFWGVFVGVAFLFTPDPTGMAPLLVGGTMIGLYEATLLLHRWVTRS
ncbi:MAG: twin-arginine translocase subunit TatC [Halanaeroarchaeum sp.]